MKICQECGRKFEEYDKYYNVLCKKCKHRILKKISLPIFTKYKFFKKKEIEGVDIQNEYKFSEELNWINNKRFATDYWMYN